MVDERRHDVVGVDNINDYYDPKLKHDRLAILNDYDAFPTSDEVNHPVSLYAATKEL